MIELRIESAAVGGAGVGRDQNGRVVFAEGGLPDETVVVELHEQKRTFARGRVIDVLTPSPNRVEPICSTARSGCGGCDLAHAALGLQRDMKVQIVVDALQRIARVDEVPEISVRATTDAGYRTTLRAAVVDGCAGYRRRWSHDVVVAPECRVAHPLAEALLVGGRWGAASEVTIRVSDATGRRVAIVDGDVNGDVEGVVVPGDVIVVPAARAASAVITEFAAGRSWQVSGDSFFQPGPLAATALVDAVRAAVGDVSGTRLVDAYGGVGLFAGTVGADADHVTLVESSRGGCRDARANLQRDGSVGETHVVRSPVERWRPQPAAVVIADPARTGLGAAAVEVLAATRAERFVLVSCDSGSLGRDVGLLRAVGYRISSVEIVDAFPDTGHVETVVGFVR